MSDEGGKKMFREVVFQREEKYIRKFLALPGKLYTAQNIMQDKKTEREILMGNHMLSHYFAVEGIIILDNKNNPVARCLLTYYHDDPQTVYLGYYEAYDNEEASKMLFETAKKQAMKRQAKKIVGPLDASFWIRYRLKVNKFETPYTGEPYNREYYEKQFKQAGFKETDVYYSHCFGVMDESYSNPNHVKRLQEKMKAGYEIISPNQETFLQSLKEIYRLISELYCNFATYKPISEEEFVTLFSPLQRVIDYSMVKLVKKDGETVAFYVSFPNYTNLISGNITLYKLLKILKQKKNPTEYVMPYMGVDRKHLGLGRALTECIKTQLAHNKATSIAALIHEGKMSEGYYRELVEDRYKYILMEVLL